MLNAIRRRLLRGSRPVLSVVVPVYNVEAYLRECLDSILGQSLRELELIAVDDGSTDRSPAILAEVAARDRRLGVLRQANAGQGAARNLGVSRARGEFLAFVDADDLVPADAFAAMVDGLRASGSDFAVGAARRLEDGELTNPSWNAVVHEHDRIGVTIDEVPQALTDVIACNRMFRRRFWTERVREFPTGVLYEDHQPMVAAYLRARRFDLLRRVTYTWRIRPERTSTGQQKHQLRHLTDRVEVHRRTLAMVGAEASEAVRAAWVARVLDLDFAAYLEPGLRADDAYRATLQQTYATYLPMATPEAMAHVRVRGKVRSHLAARGAWDDLEIAQRTFAERGSIPPTVVEDGRIRVADDLTAPLSQPIPPEALELSRNETRFQAVGLHAEWVDATTWRLTGWAIIRGLDLDRHEVERRAWLEAADGSARVSLTLRPATLPQATEWVGWAHGSFDSCGFELDVDVAALLAGNPGVRDWRLRLRLSTGGIVREGAVHNAVAGSSASRGAITSRAVTPEGLVAVPAYDPQHGLTLTLRRPLVVADALEPGFEGRTARGRLRPATGRSFAADGVRATERDSGARTRGTLSGTGFSLQLPPGLGDWELRATGLRRSRPVEWPPFQTAEVIEAIEGPLMHWRRAPSGHVRIVTDRPLVEAVAVEAEGDALVVEVRASPASASSVATARLVGDAREMAPTSIEEFGEGSWRLRIPPPARDGAIPTGSYRLSLNGADDAPHQVTVAAELVPRLPLELEMERQRVRAGVVGQRELRLEASPPLDAEERSGFGQEQLRARYAVTQPVATPAILFHHGGQAPPEPIVAIAAALARLAPQLPAYWSVADLSIELPEGGVPLVVGSREWYAMLASVSHLCADADIGSFFVRRAHQRTMRVMGAPPDAGRGAWWDAGLTPGRIGHELGRFAQSWDVLAVVGGLVADDARRELEFAGEVVSGSPDAMAEALLRPR